MAEKPKILKTDKDVPIDFAVGELKKYANIVVSEDDEEATLINDVKDAVVIMTCYGEITRKVIEAGNKLKGIVKYGVGVDAIDLVAATDNDVIVVNIPRYGTETVAEHALTLLLTLTKRLKRVDRLMDQKGWVWPYPQHLSWEIFNKKIGVIGFGKIGSSFSRFCLGFGMKIVAYDPYVSYDEMCTRLKNSFKNQNKTSDDQDDDFGIEVTNFGKILRKADNLDDLLKECDFVSLHPVLTADNEKMIGERELKLMKKNSFLINVSRGRLVDEDALLRAVKEGWIAGCGIDTFTEEPLVKGNEWQKLDNVVITPHFAWYTHEAVDRLERETIERTLEILNDKESKIDNVRNPDLLEKRKKAT